MVQSLSLASYSEAFRANFENFRNSFPDTYLAGEKSCEILGMLSQRLLVPKEAELWHEVIPAMLFGCTSSWSFSFIATTAGLDEVALTSIRRSIEFTCYIAKIVRSKGQNERAKIWRDMRESKETLITFRREFSIPKSFFSEKYSNLRQLLLTYDHASDFAIHANLSMLASKASDSDDELRLSVFDNEQDIPVSAGNIIQFGSWIIESLMADLKQLLQGYDEIQFHLELFRQCQYKAKVEIKKFYAQDTIAPSIRAAMEPPLSYLDTEFEKLKKKHTDYPPATSSPPVV